MATTRRTWLLAAVFAVLVSPLARGAEAPQAAAEAKRISVAEAKAALEGGKAVLIDVRVKQAYDAEHAKGALSVPLAELPNRFAELPKDKLIIAYCT